MSYPQDWSAFCIITNGAIREQNWLKFSNATQKEYVHAELFEQTKQNESPRNLAQHFVPLCCQALFSTDEIHLQLWWQKGSFAGHRCYLQVQCTVWACLECLFSKDFWNQWLKTLHHVIRWQCVTYVQHKPGFNVYSWKKEKEMKYKKET